MKVTLEEITNNAEATIAEHARVSSPRENKREDYEGLIKYLVKHKHWSPFEMANATFKIETSRAIAAQLLRHRSFSFQEFSQRYSNVKLQGEMFEPIELRREHETNRQSSTDVVTDEHLDGIVKNTLLILEDVYNLLIEEGVAKECARMVLPLATKTTLYMRGSIRSWIHFLEVRDDEHAQKEAQLIAQEIRKALAEHLPNVIKSSRDD